MPLLKFERVFDASPSKRSAANDTNISDGLARFQSRPALGSVARQQFFEQLFARFQFRFRPLIRRFVQLLLNLSKERRRNDGVKMHLMTSSKSVKAGGKAIEKVGQVIGAATSQE